MTFTLIIFNGFAIMIFQSLVISNIKVSYLYYTLTKY